MTRIVIYRWTYGAAISALVLLAGGCAKPQFRADTVVDALPTRDAADVIPVFVETLPDCRYAVVAKVFYRQDGAAEVAEHGKWLTSLVEFSRQEARRRGGNGVFVTMSAPYLHPDVREVQAATIVLFEDESCVASEAGNRF